ncbi:MAG: DUF192 domain-containing protein [Ignavibacteriales bacterium]|nr:DUF192 domain-containing protein [Ignavibacteriales bacterium]
MQIVVLLVIAASLGYLVLSNLLTSKEVSNSEVDKTMNSKITYTFQKEGELVFANSNGGTISKIDIEIADDDTQRQVGLMMRRNMKLDQGMLFLFEEETYQSFWMKNTILPLDIIYVNSQKEIVTIYKNAKPYSEESLPSSKPAQYVVEVNAGYTDQFGINEGDKVVWRRD